MAISVFPVHAAEIYLEAAKKAYSPNETVAIDVRLNFDEAESINAVAVIINFDNQALGAVDFLTGNSFLTFIDKPAINQGAGTISFNGIIPGGYIGRLAGDPDRSNLLGRVVFQVKKSGLEKTTINLSRDSIVYLNSPSGIKTKTILDLLEINILKDEVVFNPNNELKDIINQDKISPEDFKPEIVKIENQYFLIFTSQDKQSGIDHYEISFSKGWSFRKNNDFKTVESPYLLSSDEREKGILLKAIDKAGNERLVKIMAPRKVTAESWLILGLGLILIILSLSIFKLFKKTKGRK
ncbi:MAG: cohesin domain-containing protein [Candidatus Parcubacteria bacterium]|nr:cohesin domain-containing protein [Candidatus Parcubacteria bacterium]